MNPVLILTHNGLELTKRCASSVHSQDINTELFILDNGSLDGTLQWLQFEAGEIHWDAAQTNEGVSKGWNEGLRRCFEGWLGGYCEHVLVIGSDTVLPPWFYRELLSYPEPFVTGVAVDTMEGIANPPTERRTEPHPDFSAFLIRKECWEKVGHFDESMMLYASDCDMHVRGHRAGVPMVKVPVAFYHERSSTLRLANPEEKIWINTQANKDRQAFRDKYGCIPGERAYEDLFKNGKA